MKFSYNLALSISFGLAAVPLSSGSALCSNLGFTLDNNSSQDITAVYLSKHSTPGWGNALPNSATKAGSSNNIGYDDGKTSTSGDDCNYDIELLLLGGNGKAIIYSVDLCAATDIALGTKTVNGNNIHTFTVTYNAYSQ